MAKKKDWFEDEPKTKVEFNAEIPFLTTVAGKLLNIVINECMFLNTHCFSNGWCYIFICFVLLYWSWKWKRNVVPKLPKNSQNNVHFMGQEHCYTS